MRELAVVGFVALAFGLLSYHATDHVGAFSLANGALGVTALLACAALGAQRLRALGGPHSRRAVARGLLGVIAAILAAVALERAASLADLRFDWTFERRYELAPATRQALAALPGRLEILLFYDPLDPRIRRTRMLVDTLARLGDVAVRALDVRQAAGDMDAFGVRTSNSLVLRLGEDFEVVERPTEGALFESLSRLRRTRAGVIALLRGEGQGDPERRDVRGFSGLVEALLTEGYEVRSLVSAGVGELPGDVDAVLSIAPQRRLRDTALAALRHHLARGGSLVALLEPGVESGVEEILADYGIYSPQFLLVDPASGAMAEEARGLAPVARHYEEHPITAGLDRNRMTFFSGVRSFVLRKPHGEDELLAVVRAGPDSWLTEDLSLLERRGGGLEPGAAPRNYHPIAVAGRYRRGGAEIRILAFGDSDFASNQHLRALYNLDLALNGIHWAVQREPAITLRPKLRTVVQFPLPVSDSLQMLYGVGLLVPELLLITGGIVWLRRRAA
ncbi:MAG TPA: Gldg family protein [Myxococcota bacterium]